MLDPATKVSLHRILKCYWSGKSNEGKRNNGANGLHKCGLCRNDEVMGKVLGLGAKPDFTGLYILSH